MKNLILSFELISLLDWMLKNKKSEIDQLINEAVKNGTIKVDEQSDYKADSLWAHEIIQSLINFLEKTIKNSIEKVDILEAQLREQLTELADNVDLSAFDDVAILQGFKQAKNQIAKNEKTQSDFVFSKKLLKQILMQRILENWHPTSTAAQA